MNVYVVELSKRLADLGIEVDIFTRATSSALPARVELMPGVTVRNVAAGPYEGLTKNELPAQLCTFARAVLRAEAIHEPGWYDVIHSHYWLSGQVGLLARDRWAVPLVHTMHTMAKVKNASLADDDVPEPPARLLGEEQVVESADRLLANTDDEAQELISLYGAQPAKVGVVNPGVDLDMFSPGDQAAARHALGLPDGCRRTGVRRADPAVEGAGHLLIRAAARMLERDPSLRRAVGRRDHRRSVGQRDGAPRGARRAGPGARGRRRHPVREADRAAGAGRVVPSRIRGLRSVVLGVLRAGRAGGAGLRYAGGRGGRRRPDARRCWTDRPGCWCRGHERRRLRRRAEPDRDGSGHAARA